MILVVQLSRGAARLDVMAVKHHQVSYMVCRRFTSRRIGVPGHSLPCFFQSFLGLIMHGVHSVGVGLAGGVQWFRRHRAHGYWMEAIVSVKRGHTVYCSDRVVVGELGHRHQPHSVVLFLSDEGSKVGLDGLFESFRLPVRLWVDCR